MDGTEALQVMEERQGRLLQAYVTTYTTAFSERESCMAEMAWQIFEEMMLQGRQPERSLTLRRSVHYNRAGRRRDPADLGGDADSGTPALGDHLHNSNRYI